MSLGIIYYIRNVETGKIYIGQTIKRLSYRWSAHKTAAFAARVKHPLYDSMRKHGPGGFETGILAHADSHEELDGRERLFIALFNTQNPEHGYNLTSGGQSAYSHSVEVRQRNSAANKGRQVSPETIAKIQEARAGYRHSEETKRKMSDALRGKSLSQEHCAALRDAWTKRDASTEHCTDEWRRNVSEAIKKHWQTRKRRAPQPPRKRFFSPEHIAAITAAQQRRRKQERDAAITAVTETAVPKGN